MNITDFKGEVPEGDALKNMLEKQWELEQKYRPMEATRGYFTQFVRPDLQFPVDLDSGQAQILVKDGMERIIEELMEAANTLKNKPWKQSEVPTDVIHFMEEMADAWHFMLRLWLVVGGSPDKTYDLIQNLYFKKADVNKFRQESKY